jgi:hypothetical protein
MSRGICPYCGSHEFQNSWGQGNAYCVKCKQEFIVSVSSGVFKGERIQEKEVNQLFVFLSDEFPKVYYNVKTVEEAYELFHDGMTHDQYEALLAHPSFKVLSLSLKEFLEIAPKEFMTSENVAF